MKMKTTDGYAVHRAGRVISWHMTEQKAREVCIDLLTCELQYGPSSVTVSPCTVFGSPFHPYKIHVKAGIDSFIQEFPL